METFTPSQERASRACHRMDRRLRRSPIAGPTSLLLDSQGGLYFVEQQTLLPGGVVLRYITPDGHLKTIAGNLMGGFSGDGGQAAQAATGMQNRTGLAFDATGNLYVADGFNHRVRVIAPNGIISTFAGNGTVHDSGRWRLGAKCRVLYSARAAVRRAWRSVDFRRGRESHSRGIGRAPGHQRGAQSDEFFRRKQAERRRHRNSSRSMAR